MGSEAEDAAQKGMKAMVAFGAVFQVVMVICYAALFKYGEGSGEVGGTNFTDGGIRFYYPMFQDVHVMIFIGFGFLMTFLKRYGFNAVGLNFMIGGFIIEWALLMNAVFHSIWEGHTPHDINIDIVALIFGDFAAGCVLITFGALLGKVSPFQMLMIGLIEIIFYNINEKIGVLSLEVVDMGGSMFVHTFGAYFGLGCAYVIGRGNERLKDHPLNGSNKTSDTFAMIGTIFLWMFWPSFNGAMATEAQKHRVVVNTVLSLAACCYTSFIMSGLYRPGHKFDMVDIQNATLAGGVAVGSAADLVIEPYGALIVGTIAAVVSVLGYIKVQPFLEQTIGLYDTCGVHNLHGMPGILGGLGGVFCAMVADDSTYPGGAGGITQIYPARAHRTPKQQAGCQLAACMISVFFAMFSGAFTGLIVKQLQKFDPVNEEFTDAPYWEGGENEVGSPTDGAEAKTEI